MQQQLLNLDEALISLNNTLTDDGIRLLFQLDECHGCPAVTIKEIPKMSMFDFKVTTKHQVNLQLRDNQTGEHICDWRETFNDRGFYALDVLKSTSGRNCRFTTLDEGLCKFCPIAMLAFAIFIITLIEAIFTFTHGKIIKKKALRDAKLLNNKDTSIVATDGAQPAVVLQDKPDPEPDIDGVKYVIDSQMTSDVVNENSQNNIDMKEANAETDEPPAPSSEANNNLIKPIQSRRAESLDVFRGLTISGMIFVNYGGAGYSFLEHSAWNGITVADLVFPFFIFMLGFSIPISIRTLMKSNIYGIMIIRKIMTRSLVLLCIGLCLNSMSLSDGDLLHLRIPGVLQRFAITYLFVAITYYVSALIQKRLDQSYPSRISKLSILSSAFETSCSLMWLSVYIYFTFFWEYDIGCPIGYTGPGGISDEGKYYNCTGGAASYIDRYLFGEDHLYLDHEIKDMYLTNIKHDPEGLLGCSTSILLAMIGLQCGKILLGYKSHHERLRKWLNWILVTGVLSSLVYVIPINKKMWSLTFVSFNALMANITYLLLYILVDVVKVRTIFIRLLSSAGKNSLFLYIGHSICEKMVPWYFAVDENSHPWLLARLTWATLLWLLIAHWMASRSIFIKI